MGVVAGLVSLGGTDSLAGAVSDWAPSTWGETVSVTVGAEEASGRGGRVVANAKVPPMMSKRTKTARSLFGLPVGLSCFRGAAMPGSIAA